MPSRAAFAQCRRAARRKVRPAGGRERAALAFGIVAAVVGHRQPVACLDRRDVRHLLRRDEIAAAYLVAGKSERVGDAVEQAFHHEHPLRTPGAAGRGRRREIGQAQRDFEPIRRQHIGADEIGGGVLRQRKAGRRGGAVVVAQVAADREQLADAVDRCLDVPILLALVIGGGEALAAVLDPFDRAPERQRGRGDRQLLGIERVLWPEAPADVGRDHPYALFRQPERFDQDPFGLVRHLGRIPDCEQIVV